MNNIQLLRNSLEQQKGAKQQLEKSLSDLQDQLQYKKRSLIRHKKAREIIRIVGQKTQEQLSFHISDITCVFTR